MRLRLFLLFREVNSTKHQTCNHSKADPDRKVRGVAGVGGLGSDGCSGSDRTIGGSGGGTSAGGRSVGLELEVRVCAFDFSRLVERLTKEQIERGVCGQVRLVQRDCEGDLVVFKLKVAVLGAGVVDLLGEFFVGVDFDVFRKGLHEVDVSRFVVVQFRSGIAKVDGDIDVGSTISVSGGRNVRSGCRFLIFRRAGSRAGGAGRTGRARAGAGAAGLVVIVFRSDGVDDSKAEERECHEHGKDGSNDFAGLGSGHNECLLRVFAGSRRNGILQLTVYIFSVPNTIKK